MLHGSQLNQIRNLVVKVPLHGSWGSRNPSRKIAAAAMFSLTRNSCGSYMWTLLLMSRLTAHARCRTPSDVPSLWFEVGPRRRNRSRRRVRWQRAKFIGVGLCVGESLDAVVRRGV